MNEPENSEQKQPIEGCRSLQLAITDWGEGRLPVTNETIFIRFKLGRTSSAKQLSKNNLPQIVDFHRGEGENKITVGSFILTSFEIKRGQWVEVRRIEQSKALSSFSSLNEENRQTVIKLSGARRVVYRVIFGRGEKTPENTEEVFLFAAPPTEIESDKTKISQWQTSLGEWVLALINREHEELLTKAKAEGIARVEEQLKKYPRRFAHESKTVDHYKNRHEVFVKLLRNQWPRFCHAVDKLKVAKTNEGKSDGEKKVLIAFLADHKANYGFVPDINQEDAAGLSRNDYYIRLMNEALNAPGDSTDKRDWQLVNGWIEKDYYRMNDAALESAFNKDWNYKTKQHKGNTLAKRARNLGLQFALKRGRPENPNSLPAE